MNKNVSIEDMQNINNKFAGMVCEDCKKRISEYINRHKAWIILNPRKLQLKTAALLCGKCRNKLLNNMR